MLNQTYLKLQLSRSSRWLNYFGISPMIAYFLIPILLFGFVKLCYFKTEYAPIILTFLFGILILKLSNKKRNDFLKSIFPKESFYKLRLKENILLSLPITLFMVIQKIELLAFLPIIISIGLPLRRPCLALLWLKPWHC